MTRINLLPWREELREQRRREFLQSLALALIVAAGITLVSGMVVDSRIEEQEARNDYLQGEIDKLEERIAEIENLERERARLIDRMQVIQDLQGTRPVIVRVFDQMVRTLPDGVFYESVTMRNQRLTISGVAESNNRVSALMRELEGSDWFEEPNLKGLKEAPDFGEHASRFDLTVTQTAPAGDENEES